MLLLKFPKICSCNLTRGSPPLCLSLVVHFRASPEGSWTHWCYRGGCRRIQPPLTLIFTILVHSRSLLDVIHHAYACLKPHKIHCASDASCFAHKWQGNQNRKLCLLLLLSTLALYCTFISNIAKRNGYKAPWLDVSFSRPTDANDAVHILCATLGPCQKTTKDMSSK